MYGPHDAYMTGQNSQAGQFRGLLSKSVAEALGQGGLESITNAANQASKIVKPVTPSLILPDGDSEGKWVHKPVFFARVGQLYEFEISKDSGGWWIKARIGFGEVGEKIHWVNEFLHSNEKEPKVFRLYSRTSDPKVSILDVAKRQRMFPLGCDVRLSK